MYTNGIRHGRTTCESQLSSDEVQVVPGFNAETRINIHGGRTRTAVLLAFIINRFN